MSQLCGCFGSSKSEPRTQVPADPEAGFMSRPEMHMQHQPPRYDAVDNGYAPVVPLPRYTPRPMSIHEKTLENNSNPRNYHHQLGEKNRQDFESEETLQSQSTGSSSATVTAPTTVMDDASSAYSFPSSFGHTSTETRDTPPPPYSSCGSSFYTRSRASSLRSPSRRHSLSGYSMNENQMPNMVSAPEGTSFTAPAMPTLPPTAHVHAPYQNHQHYRQVHPHPRQYDHQPRRQSYESRHNRESQPSRQSFSQGNPPSQHRLSWESRR